MNSHPFLLCKQMSFASLHRRSLAIHILFLTIVLLWLFASAVFAQSCPLYPSPHLRIGVNVTTVGGVSIADYDAPGLGAGWYHNYRVQTLPEHPGGILYHQLARAARHTTPDELQKFLPLLAQSIANNPGQLWFVVNEGDRYGQDQLTPQQYVDFYDQIYHFIKERDPSSRIFAGGIVQPTPIRLRYLDQVLAIYKQRYGVPMPADGWHIHNFILPENCTWGAGVPPGLEEYINEGTPCPPSLDEHGNLDTFKQQVRTFRAWMNNRGYRNYPLVISEYGIILSKYHGYPQPRVRDYMLGSFDFLLNATDSQTGYPADGNRLVQEFAWFSLNDYEFNLQTYQGLNGNLFDHDSHQITPLGLDFENYVKPLMIKQIDLAMRTFSVDLAQAAVNQPVVLTAAFANQGSVAAQDTTVRFWRGDPRAGGQLLGVASSQPQILPECGVAHQGVFVWTPTQPGVYPIFAELTAANSTLESNRNNNYASLTLTVADTPIIITPTVSPTPSQTPTTAPTTTPTATASASPTPTPSPLASATPNATVTPSPTATATPKLAQTVTATPSSTGTATATRTPVIPVTVTGTARATTATTPTATATPTATPTATLTPTPSMSATPTSTGGEPTLTPTPAQTAISIDTPTAVPTDTPTPTSTAVVVGNASVNMAIDVASTTVMAGEDIRYQFRYMNNSDQMIPQLALRLRLPAYTAFNGAASSPGWLCAANSAEAECRLAAGDLAIGATGVADFVVTSESGLAHSQAVTLIITVEDNQRVITTANATVTLIGGQGFVQYLPFVQK